jgi:hypothetical protein
VGCLLQYSRLQMLPWRFGEFLTSKPADIASTIDAANSCAKAPVKTGGGPAFRRIRINDRRDSAAVKGELYFWLLIVKRSTTAPGPLELHLIDSGAEFCNEPLHRDHLIYHRKQTALRELTMRTRASLQTIADSRSLGCYTSVRP